MKDHIVEEIRKYRMEHTRKFGGDLQVICEDLRAYQAALGIRVVRLASKGRPPGYAGEAVAVRQLQESIGETRLREPPKRTKRS